MWLLVRWLLSTFPVKIICVLFVKLVTQLSNINVKSAANMEMLKSYALNDSRQLRTLNSLISLLLIDDAFQHPRCPRNCPSTTQAHRSNYAT